MTCSPTCTRTRRRAWCVSAPSSPAARRTKRMPQRNVVEAINSALADEMQADERVMVLGLDVGKLGGVFRTTSGLIEKFGSERGVGRPPAEAGIVGASLSLAAAYTVPFGKASLVREGDNVTLVAWSAAVELCLRAADALAADGISAAVLDLRTLVPLDVETLCTQVAKTGRCVVVHEAPLSAGFGAEVSATLMEEVFYDLDAPVARVGAFDVPFPAASLEDHYLPSLDRVIKAVKRTLES